MRTVLQSECHRDVETVKMRGFAVFCGHGHQLAVNFLSEVRPTCMDFLWNFPFSFHVFHISLRSASVHIASNLAQEEHHTT